MKRVLRWWKIKRGTWLKHIEKELLKQHVIFTNMLPEEFRDNSNALYIAGGCIWSLYHNKEVSDYDLFSNQENYTDAIRVYLIENMDVTFIEQPFPDSDHVSLRRGTWDNHNIIITPNAITIDKFQIITKWIGTPEEVVSQFDFIHNLNYFYKDHFGHGELVLMKGEDYLNNKYLNYNNGRARDVASTIMRLPKFQRKGFIVTKSETAKMLSRLQDIGFSDNDNIAMATLMTY